MTNQQAPEIYTLHTVLNEGERPWSGIYGVRADAEHDAKVMRDATGRDWSVVRLVVADTAAPAEVQSPWSRALEIRMAQGWKLKGDRIPVLYTDTINGEGVGRDDLWLCTTKALTASPTPPAEQPPRWVERWHGSGGKEFWEGWSILNAANREMIAHLGPDVDPDAVRGIVAAHNEALCGECAGTGGRWCPACAGATPSAEQQASATEVALVGAYARLPDFDSGDEPIWEAVFKWKAANPGSDASKKAMAVEGAIIKSLRDFADRTHALRMEQAAPKAAPTRTALPEGWTDCTIEFGNDGPEVVAYGPKRMMTRLAKWLGKYFAQVIADAAPKAAPQQEAQEPATVPRFNCWSTNEGDSWFDHPADSQAIYDCLGDAAKVGDEYELTAGWKSVTARYRITEVVGDGEEYEVECISHPHENSAPQPAPAPLSDDAKDAARYRFLAGHCRSTSEHWGGRWSIVVDGPAPKSHDSEDDFDEAVDAALDAQGGK